MSTITRILWLFVGLCAGIIDIGATWMSDLKEGICAEAFWLNREQCCWSVSNTDANDDYCQQVNAGINQILYSRSTRIHGGSIFLDFFAPPYTRINILNELWTCIPQKYVPMNQKKKNWQSKVCLYEFEWFHSMYNDQHQLPTCTFFMHLLLCYILVWLMHCTNVHLLTRNWVYFSFQWKTWSEIFGGSRSGAGSYVVTYFIYMLWAIVFAMLAALFVRVFAPYACGSGIPEVSSPLLMEAGWSTNLSSNLFLHSKLYIFVHHLSFL